MTRSWLRRAGAVALFAAAWVAIPNAAEAAGCPTADGVTVVVDFEGAGGIQSTCVTGGGGDTAFNLFEVHHDLERVQRQRGAICRVDGAPGDDQCVNMPPAHAYWGLFWADGSGGWAYSSQGVDSLNVPNGGSVAFAWQNGGGTDYPGVAPASHDDGGSGSGSGGSGGSGSGSGSGGGSGGSGSSGGGGSGSADGTTSTPSQSASPSGSASPSSKSGKPGKSDKPGQADKSKKDESEKPSESSDEESPSESPTNTSAAVADPPSAADQGGLPTWVAPVGIAVLFAAAGVVALVRRRSVG